MALLLMAALAAEVAVEYITTVLEATALLDTAVVADLV
jgi:hypothetical protein